MLSPFVLRHSPARCRLTVGVPRLGTGCAWGEGSSSTSRCSLAPPARAPPLPPLPVANSGIESTRGASSPPLPPPVGVGLRAPADPQSPVRPALPPPPRHASPDAPRRPSSRLLARAGRYRPAAPQPLPGSGRGGSAGAAPRGSSAPRRGQSSGAAHVALEAAKPTRPSSSRAAAGDRGAPPSVASPRSPGIPEQLRRPAGRPPGWRGRGSRRERRLRAGGAGGGIYFSRGSCDRKR